MTLQNPLLVFMILFRLSGFSPLLFTSPSKGFPGGSVVKNLLASAGDMGSIPGTGRSPGEGNGNPLQYSCLGNPMDRGAWQATVNRVAETVRHNLVTKQQLLVSLPEIGLTLRTFSDLTPYDCLICFVRTMSVITRKRMTERFFIKPRHFAAKLLATLISLSAYCLMFSCVLKR